MRKIDFDKHLILSQNTTAKMPKNTSKIVSKNLIIHEKNRKEIIDVTESVFICDKDT